jgi:hypothetical protein
MTLLHVLIIIGVSIRIITVRLPVCKFSDLKVDCCTPKVLL